jgi:hypothetical protein
MPRKPIKNRPAKKTAKKAAKKPAAKPKRRICKTKGCRKSALAESELCKTCTSNAEASEQVVRVTEIEALRFGKLDAEMRNDRQAVQLLDYQMTAIKNKAEADISNLNRQKQQLLSGITARKPEYKALINDLAEKYGIEDPNKMTIDPDTGVIRDLSQV